MYYCCVLFLCFSGTKRVINAFYHVSINLLYVHFRYCSEACGRLLARQRLMDILPKQIHVWQSTPTVANEVAKEELERIRKRMIFARKELESLGTVYSISQCAGFRKVIPNGFNTIH